MFLNLGDQDTEGWAFCKESKLSFQQQSWKTEFYTVVALILVRSLLQKFQHQWVKFASTSPENLYTTGAEEGLKVSVTSFTSSGSGGV